MYFGSRFKSNIYSIFLSQKLTECSEPIQVGMGENLIFVDKNTSYHITQVKELYPISGHTRGKTIYNFTNTPGYVYAVGIASN